MNQYDILVSSDGTNFTEVLSNQTLTVSPNTGVAVSAQQVALVQSGISHVRFHIDSNHGDVNVVGLSEVKFNGTAAVPEPSSSALLGLGGLALMLRRRK